MHLKAKFDTALKFKLDQTKNLNPLEEYITLKKGFNLETDNGEIKRGHLFVDTGNLKGWIFLNHWKDLSRNDRKNTSKTNWLWESIKEFEGFRSEPYLDTGGVLTIGYGRTHNIVQNEVTTPEKEKLWTLNYLNNLKNRVNQLVSVSLTDFELDALTHFVYNIGTGNFKNSTLLRKLNQNDKIGAANEFPRWNKDAKRNVLPGLVRRREHERNHFLGLD